MPPEAKHRRAETAWRLAGLASILLVLAGAKLAFDPYPVGDFGRDGSYYFQVARHVAEGHGLVTSVSLYRQGLNPLPHPSTAYPAWPLLLGGAGALLGLETAASLVPELLFFVALVLLYFLANAVGGAWGDPTIARLGGAARLDLGHLAVALMGFNGVFFKYTSLPFADGLAFGFAFAALATLAPLGRRASGGWAGVAGLLAALAFLARSQMLGVAIAIPVALGLAGARSRAHRRAAAVAAGASAAAIVPWVAYLRQSVESFRLAMLVDFTALRATPELPAYRWSVATGSLVDLVADRAAGLWVAFDPVGRMSYVESFGPIAYLPPALVLWLVARPRSFGSALRAALDPRWLVVAGCALAAVACLAPVHLAHADRHWGWFFNFRHGLPLILAIVLALGFSLLRGPRLLRGAAWVLTAASLAWGAAGVARELGTRYRGPGPAERALGDWIAMQASPPVLLTTRPWSLGAVTRGLFHGVDCDDPPAHTQVYFEHAGVDALVTSGFDLDCPFFTGVREELAVVREFGSGTERITVWRRQGPGPHSM